MGLKLGQGWDTINGEHRNTCVRWTGTVQRRSLMTLDAPKPCDPASPADTRWKVILVNSAQDLFSSLSLGAAAKFDLGIFSTNAAFNYVSLGKLSTYDEYLSSTVSIENPAETLNNVKLISDYQTLYHKDPAAFRRQCGDRYIEGEITGGIFDALFHATATTEGQQTDAAAAFSAAFLVGEMNANVEAKFAHMISEGRLTVEIMRKGPAEDIPSDPVSIMRYAETFPCKVSSGSIAHWRLYLTAASYDSLAAPIPAAAEQDRVLNAIGDRINDLYTVTAGLRYIQQHQDEFSPVAGINAYLSKLDGLRTTLSANATSCMSDPTKCTEPGPLALPLLPRRAEWRDVSPKQNYTDLCTTVYDEYKIVEAKGSWYAGPGPQDNPHQLGDDQSWFLITDAISGNQRQERTNKDILIYPNQKVQFYIPDPAPLDNSAGPEGLHARCGQTLPPLSEIRRK